MLFKISFEKKKFVKKFIEILLKADSVSGSRVHPTPCILFGQTRINYLFMLVMGVFGSYL